MAEVTRRGFIKKTSVGAVALGTMATVPGMGMTAAHAAAGHPATDLTAAELREPLVAHVRNVASGEIAVMVGEREVIIQDRELAARLARAAR